MSKAAKRIKQFIGHTNFTWGIAISADSQTLVTTASDATVRIWDIPSGEELNRYNEHSGWVLEAVFSPDESFIVTASEDLTLRRWHCRADGRGP